MDGPMEEPTNGWLNLYMDRRMNGRTDEWMNERTNRRTDEQTDGWTNASKNVCPMFVHSLSMKKLLKPVMELREAAEAQRAAVAQGFQGSGSRRGSDVIIAAGRAVITAYFLIYIFCSPLLAIFLQYKYKYKIFNINSFKIN